MTRRAAAIAAAAISLGAATPALAHGGGERDGMLRFATFNASVNRNADGQLLQELSNGDDPQLRNVAEIIQRVRPDVAAHQRVRLRSGPARGTSVPAQLPRRCRTTARGRSSTATASWLRRTRASPSGKDFDNDGQAVTQPGSGAYGNDRSASASSLASSAWSSSRVRASTTRTLGPSSASAGGTCPATCCLTIRPRRPRGWYSADELGIFRLSSKSHWDVPWRSTATGRALPREPPDAAGVRRPRGPQRQAQPRRDPLLGGLRDSRCGHYIYDDEGRRGGLRRGEQFVIAGDQNADPFDGDGVDHAIRQLLDNPRINASVTPTSPGGAEQSQLQGGANMTHRSDPPMTRRTSPTAHRATCARTTCCPPVASGSVTASCSGR